MNTIPKDQKIEYWRKSNYSSTPKESLESFVDRFHKDGWFVHQIIPFNSGQPLDAAYIIFYKYVNERDK